MSKLKSWTAKWPIVASVFFWIGAIMQIIKIITEGSTGQSAFAWLLYSGLLFGYALFYRVHLDEVARKYGIAASLIGSALYFIIFLMVLF